MVSLEYLPYYWKLSNHSWQLYTLGAGIKFFHMLRFDLYQGHMIKKLFFGVHPPVIAAQQNLLTAEVSIYTYSYYQKRNLIRFWE